jgi:streptogramin lyase
MLRRLLAVLTGSALVMGATLAVTASPAGAAVGDITTYPVPALGATPRGITTGPDANVWFTNFTDDSIGRIDPDDGTITLFTDPAGNVDLPGSIATGTDGNLWFTSFGNSRIGRLDPDDGSITTFGGGPDSPATITAGPDGNLWFTNFGSTVIGRITTSG